MKHYIAFCLVLSISSIGNLYAYSGLEKLPSTCIQAYDECNNICSRSAGATDRACTEMACAGNPVDARCIASTDDIDLKQTICTMDYTPVCGEKPVQCIKAPCNPIQQTYGNVCTMNADGATLVHTGECKTDTMVGNDKDSHGCIGSAGYSWSQSKQACVRIREYQATNLEKAYDFAFNHGITTMETLKKFRAQDTVTRQEAAKMFVAFIEQGLSRNAVDLSTVLLVGYLDDAKFDYSLKDFIYKARIHNIIQGSKNYFMPFASLSRAQTLAILMRIVDGWQDETVSPRWFKYSEQAHLQGYIALPNHNTMEQPITRGELIERIYNFYQKQL